MPEFVVSSVSSRIVAGATTVGLILIAAVVADHLVTVAASFDPVTETR